MFLKSYAIVLALILVLPLYVFWFLHLSHPPVARRCEAGAAAHRLAVEITRAAVTRLQAAIILCGLVIL